MWQSRFAWRSYAASFSLSLLRDYGRSGNFPAMFYWGFLHKAEALRIRWRISLREAAGQLSGLFYSDWSCAERKCKPHASLIVCTRIFRNVTSVRSCSFSSVLSPVFLNRFSHFYKAKQAKGMCRYGTSLLPAFNPFCECPFIPSRCSKKIDSHFRILFWNSKNRFFCIL